MLLTDINGHNETRVFDISNINTTDTILTDLTFTNTQYYAKIYEQGYSTAYKSRF